MMKRLILLSVVLALAAPIHAQTGPIPVQFSMTLNKKKKQVSAGYGNAADYFVSSSLRIVVNNVSARPLTGVKVRWGMVQQNSYSSRRPVTYGAEETIDIQPLKEKIVETQPLQTRGREYEFIGKHGESVLGYGAQVLIDGKVVVQKTVPANFSIDFEKLTPIESDSDNRRR